MRADAPLVLSSLLLLTSPRRLARADTTTERAPPSRERVVDPDRAVGFAERASIPISALRGGNRRRAVRADAPLVLSSLLLLTSPRRLTRADTTTERAPPSRERVVDPDRAVGFAERASIPISALRGGNRRRAVRADAPLVLSSLLLLTSPRRLTRADTTTERAPPSRERVVDPDRAVGFAERASIPNSALRGGNRRRAVRADAPLVLSSLLLLTSPRRLTRADTTTERAPPSRERVVDPDRAVGFAERASIPISALRGGNRRRAVRADAPLVLSSLLLLTSPRRLTRADTTTERAPPSRERVVDPDRAVGFAERASIPISALRGGNRRRALRADAPLVLSSLLLLTSPRRLTRADTTTERAPPSRERVVDPDRAVGFAERASIPLSALRGGNRRRAVRADAPLVLSSLLLLTSPRRLTRADTTTERAPPSRERVVDPDRAVGFAERASIPISALRGGNRRRAVRADAPLVLSSLLLLTSPRRLTRADTTTERAPPSRERVVDPDRAVGFAERASIPIRALRGGNRRRAVRADAPLVLSSLLPLFTSPRRLIRADTTTEQAPPSRERVVDPDRAVGFAERASIPTSAPRGGNRRRAVRADASLVLSSLLPLFTSPRRLIRADTTTEQAPPSRERVVDPLAAAAVRRLL